MSKRIKRLSWIISIIMIITLLSNSYIVLRAEESYDNVSVLINNAVDITGKETYTGYYGSILYKYERNDGMFEVDKGELTKITLSSLTGVEINYEIGYSAEVYELVNGKLVYYDSIRGSGTIVNRASKQKIYYIWTVDDYDYEDQYSMSITYLEHVNELIDNAITVEVGKVRTGVYNENKYFYYYGDGDDESLYVSGAELFKIVLKPGTEVIIDAGDENYLTIMTEDDGLKAYDRYYYYRGFGGLANYGTEDMEYYILLEGEEGSNYRLSVEKVDVPFLKDIETKALSLKKGKNYFYSDFGIEDAFDVDEMEAFLMDEYVDDNGINHIDYYYRKGFLCKYDVPARSKITVKIIPSDVVDIQGMCSVPVYDSIGDAPYDSIRYWKEIVGSGSYGEGGIGGSYYETEDKYDNLEYVNYGSKVKTIYFWFPDYMAGNMCGINVEAQENINVPADKIRDVDVTYHTHIQSYGDSQGTKKNGQMAGTSGEAKRLENIWIDVEGNDNLGVQYSTHCQSYGWMPWSCDGETNGTSGEAKRLEAIKIQLTGADKDKYDIYYRVHAQSYGWLGWAKNGEPSGTAGYAKRLEGIQVVVVKKGEARPALNYAGIDGSSSKYKDQPYVAAKQENIVIPGDVNAPIVSYKTHVQSFGWQKWVHNGAMSGTSGQAKRLEGINIKVTNCPYDGDIVYTTHVQTYGWKDGKPEDTTRASWKKNGAMSGTSGEAKRLEAICIDLTGEMGEKYDIYYRVHAQSFGWLGWAKNGEESGTAGYAKRLEGIQIVLVPKGGKAPANDYGGVTSVRTEGYIAK